MRGGSVPAVNKKPVKEGATPSADFLKYIYCRDCYKGVAGYLWTRLFKADIFQETSQWKKIIFDKTLIPGQDVYAIAECCVRAKTMLYLPYPLYHYIQRDTSVMHQPSKRLKSMSSCRAYELSIQLFEKRGISRKIINLLKRFYVYHACLLLEMAYKETDIEKETILKRMIRKNFWVYAKTNIMHPFRIIAVIRLINRKK